LRDIKNRMKTVITIKKITSSMKAVAASKLKQAEKNKDLVQPFRRATENQFQNVPLSEAPKTYLVCAIASDRGLCGSANTSVVRTADRLLHNRNQSDINIFCIGDKSRSGLARFYKESITHLATNLDRKPVSLMELLPLVEKISQQNYDRFVLFSNKFINSLTFETIGRELPSKEEMVKNVSKYFPKVEFEGDGKQVVSDLYNFYLAGLIYASVIESIACELGSRMASMDNATKNAGEMINKLTLDFNRKRQAAITNELSEIISGAAGVEEGVVY